MYKRYNEAVSRSCEYYQETIIDPVDFTSDPYLFSIGNSKLKTRIFSGNCKCLIRFEIHDWFRDAKDINDKTPYVYDEYPFGVAYPINFEMVIKYGF